MSECIGHNVALRPSLQSIIPDGGCGLQSCVHVTGFNEIPLCLTSVGPDASKTVGLQFDSDLQTVGLSLVHGTLRLLHFWQHTQQVLYVVTNLVSNYLGLRELASLTADLASTQTPFEILKEARVEVDLLIKWTIERSHRGPCRPAAGLCSTGEHDQGGRCIGSATLSENICPHRLCTAKDS